MKNVSIFINWEQLSRFGNFFLQIFVIARKRFKRNTFLKKKINSQKNRKFRKINNVFFYGIWHITWNRPACLLYRSKFIPFFSTCQIDPFARIVFCSKMPIGIIHETLHRKSVDVDRKDRKSATVSSLKVYWIDALSRIYTAHLGRTNYSIFACFWWTLEALWFLA